MNGEVSKSWVWWYSTVAIIQDETKSQNSSIYYYVYISKEHPAISVAMLNRSFGRHSFSRKKMILINAMLIPDEVATQMNEDGNLLESTESTINIPEKLSDWQDTTPRVPRTFDAE